tara:strand:+ start:131 stop:472 length:342 start_codon:yes stop_codon:yes gene_type:complete
MSYAVGKRALGICDRCGFTYKLKELFFEVRDRTRNGLRVCKYCLDEDHPQLRIGEVETNDLQSLFKPRPDTGEKESTRYSAFNPIGGGLAQFGSSTMNLKMTGEIGKLEVSTS